jgi:predicted amidohydrolase YtcJ
MNGAGENLTWSAADFENFLEPRPDVAQTMESELEPIVDRYGADAAKATPPIGKMLSMDVPVGAGTDATRVASYDPSHSRPLRCRTRAEYFAYAEVSAA